MSAATTLIIGGTASTREAAIATVIDPASANALILEGLPDGASRLDALAASGHVQISRIAPGCACCTGNLTMRVTLNRMLRRHPTHLYIGLATSEHLAGIRAFLTQAPYDKLLHLAKELHA